MALLADYIEGWRRHDADMVAATLAPDCVVTECYGPVYRGVGRVREWMAAWLAAGGAVIAWDITQLFVLGDEVEMAEWRFTCRWHGEVSSFEGATVVRIAGGRITSLREYATTAPLYDWTGRWRDEGGQDISGSF